MGGHRISAADIATERFWQIAILVVVGAFGSTSRAEAAVYYWQDSSEPGYYQPGTPVQQPRKSRRHSAKKDDAPEKDIGGAKPQGPLIISVSISKQRVRIYDANGFFAEAPVSTGMSGHPTPMGVFSVIQKHKWHHSNIYSGAPMPYMQRITWSGVAMHAGVLPGYPASHGCIRMPMAFAVKMWNWTRMGARVLVTPGEMTPASFSHPLLPAFKVAPHPAVAEAPPASTPTAVKADKGTPEAKPVTTGVNLELRPTVGHNESVKAATDEAPAPLKDQTHTADASGNLPAGKSTMSDAPSANNAPSVKDIGATESDPSDAAKIGAAAEAKKPDAGEAVALSEKPEASKDAAKDAAKATGDEAKSAEPAMDAKADDKPAADRVGTVSVEAKVESKADAPKQESPAKADEELPKSVSSNSVLSNSVLSKSVLSTPVTAKPGEKPADSMKQADAVKGASEPASGAADATKDPARLLDADKPAVTKAEPPKRTGQIAVFISRKDSKLYVRQNFAPLYDVPVTIAPDDRPLGTHVFTADVDKNDTNVLHWSVVSLPVSARAALRDTDEERVSRRRKAANAVAEAKPLPSPDSPAEALDRITIPADTMARIAEAMTTGGSIIVSDQGINQGETGEGTDFIVSLR